MKCRAAGLTLAKGVDAANAAGIRKPVGCDRRQRILGASFGWTCGLVLVR